MKKIILRIMMVVLLTLAVGLLATNLTPTHSVVGFLVLCLGASLLTEQIPDHNYEGRD
jgi:hypothetical protein